MGGSPKKSSVFGLEVNYHFREDTVLYKDVRLYNLTRYVSTVNGFFE